MHTCLHQEDRTSSVAHKVAAYNFIYINYNTTKMTPTSEINIKRWPTIKCNHIKNFHCMIYSSLLSDFKLLGPIIIETQIILSTAIIPV